MNSIKLTFTKTTVMNVKLFLTILLSAFGVASLQAQEVNKITAGGTVNTIEISQSKENKSSERRGVKNAEERTPVVMRANDVIEDGMQSKDGIFFSNGAIYVGANPSSPGTGDETPSLFIQGSAYFANQAQIEMEKGGVASLTGDFVSRKEGAADAVAAFGALEPLFVKTKDAVTQDVLGAIRFVGQWNKQDIYREYPSFIPAAGEPTWLRVADSRKFNSAKGQLTLAGQSESYILNFPSIQVRKEGISTLADIPDQDVTGTQTYNVEEMGMVAVSPNTAIIVEQLDLVGGYRFSVEGRTPLVATYGDDQDAFLTAWESYPDDSHRAEVTSMGYTINYGYADVRSYAAAASGVNPGHTEVNMKSYFYTKNHDVASTDGLVKATNGLTVSKGTTDPDYFLTYMRGISSPFTSLRSDYMFYHVLTEPTYGNVAGALNAPIASPQMKFTPGVGYFYAMDVSRDYFDNINSTWQGGTTPGWTARARGGYNFSRVVQEYKNKVYMALPGASGKGISLFSLNVADATNANKPYDEQRFNTDPVEVHLTHQFVNILGNPYMFPISLSGLLAETKADGSIVTPTTDAQLLTPFVPSGSVGNDPTLAGTQVGTTLKAVHALTTTSSPSNTSIAAATTGSDNGGLPYALVRAAYWVVNSAFVTPISYRGEAQYAYHVKYDYVDYGTSATTVTNPFDRYLEPMQIFALQVAAPTNFDARSKFVFNKNMVAKKGLPFVTSIVDDTMGNELPIPDDPAVSPRTVQASDEIKNITVDGQDANIIPDWFVVETMVKNTSVTADRTAVRFFENSTLGFDKDRDQKKALTLGLPSIDDETITKTALEVSTDLEDVNIPKNVVYTTSSRGDQLLANTVGYNTKEIPLHYIPANYEEEVVLKVFGLEGLDKVTGVWLIDKENNNYKQNLLEDDEYTFVSKPVDNPLSADNRFILRFYDGDDDGDNNPSLTEKPISTYYSGSTLYISGLNKNDMGSAVQIFDMQGRLMGNTVVNNYPSMQYAKPLGQGTFVVKIIGARNYTSKFVNIQNY